MMLRLISSVIGGLLLAFTIVFATDAASHAMFPTLAAVPETNDPEAMQRYVAGQPTGVLSAILVGWAIAVFAGSAVASRFGDRRELPGWIVTGLFLLATLMNFILVQHPIWMVVTGLGTIVVAGWLGARLTGRTSKPGRTPIPH
jgi:MFS family permease